MITHDDKNKLVTISDGETVRTMTPEQFERHMRDPEFAKECDAPMKPQSERTATRAVSVPIKVSMLQKVKEFFA